MAEQRQDSSTDFFLILLSSIIFFGAIFYFFSYPIKYSYLTIKLIELKLITFFYPHKELLSLIKYIESTSINDWTYSQINLLGKHVGIFFNIVYVIIFGFLTLNIWKKNPLHRLKRVLTMQSLKKSEQKIWPYISPIIDIDLIKQPFDSGPYAMAAKPYEYAVKHKLLLNDSDTNSLDKIKTEKHFISQLGKIWQGFDKLKPHEKALIAIFAAQGCGDKKGAIAAVNAIAISATSDYKNVPDFSSAKPLFKYIEDPKVQNIIKKHAYIYTVLNQMLEFARETGVLPTSYFIWLKPRDRILFYTLNCVGRQVAFIEVAGIFGHWKAEQIAGHKLEAPYVVKAVDGLERALGEVKLVT